jgi:hypothetical protein
VEVPMLKHLLDPDSFYKALPLVVLFIYNILALSTCFFLIEMEIHIARGYITGKLLVLLNMDSETGKLD